MKKFWRCIPLFATLWTAEHALAAPVDIQGSDTLEGLITDLVTSDCRSLLDSPPNPPNTIDPSNNTKIAGFLHYIGGGSGTAPTAMIAQLGGTGQQVAGPMSRAINSGECSAAEAAKPGSAALAQGLVIGLDGIVVVGDSQNSVTCGGGHTDHGDDEIPGPQFSNLPVSTATWKAKLSLLYTGVGVSSASDINRNCNTSDRVSLVSSYANLFEGGCTDTTICPGGVRHAFRRGDLSGTTDTFLSLLGLPSIVRTPAGTGPVTATPFCNGLDTEDRDPIRRTCSDLEQVCEYDGTLGLVLPIVVPTTTNETAALYNTGNTSDSTQSPVYYNRDPAPAGDIEASGDFALVKAPSCTTGPSNNAIDPTGTLPVAGPGVMGYNSPVPFPNDLRCDCRFPVPTSYTSLGFPSNPAFNWNMRYGGKCFGTRHVNPDGTVRYGLLNGDNGTQDNTPISWGNKFPQPPKVRCCRAGTPLTFYKMDPRLTNLVVRNPLDTSGPGICLGGSLNGLNCQGPAFYRIHSSSLGITVVGQGDPGIEACKEPDATRQIACIVQWQNTSNCSVGYAGREAGDTTVALTAEPFSIGGITPTVLNIQKLVSTDPATVAAAYPLARRLYYSTFVGFDSGVLTSPHGAATDPYGAQYNLYKCLADSTPRANTGISAQDSALGSAGFVSLPGGPKICHNMCTSNTSCGVLDPVPAADLSPAFVP